MTSDEFAALTDVSRETMARLEAYLNLISRWQRAINLVGPATLSDPWRRHLLDSAQLLDHMPKAANAIYDLGSGAGLPGLVLAIMGQTNIHLVESDQRKAQFLSLLDLASPLLHPSSLCLFLKGRSALDELTEARKCWRMSADLSPSLSDSSASVLKLWDIVRAPLHR